MYNCILGTMSVSQSGATESQSTAAKSHGTRSKEMLQDTSMATEYRKLDEAHKRVEKKAVKDAQKTSDKSSDVFTKKTVEKGQELRDQFRKSHSE